MINLNKDNKKRRLGASMKIICTIIVTVALLAGVIAIGFMVTHQKIRVYQS